MKGYGPVTHGEAPRVAGVPTFLRLPHLPRVAEADVAVLGLPWESEGAERGGARQGPRAVREASQTLRPLYHPAQRLEPFARVSAVDAGDARAGIGLPERGLEAMVEALVAVHAAGAVPLGIGGDRLVTLAGLRAAARRHGPLALVWFGAHGELLEESRGERFAAGTVLRRALDEGLVDPRRSAVLGLRGGLDAPDAYARLREAGFTVMPWEDLMQLGTGAVAAAVERAEGPAFLSVSLDFFDPAFAPGVAEPEVGGPSSLQGLALVRGCRGLGLVGGDVVDVLPEHDAAGLTALLAATLVWDLVTLVAAGRPEGGR